MNDRFSERPYRTPLGETIAAGDPPKHAPRKSTFEEDNAFACDRIAAIERTESPAPVTERQTDQRISNKRWLAALAAFCVFAGSHVLLKQQDKREPDHRLWGQRFVEPQAKQMPDLRIPQDAGPAFKGLEDPVRFIREEDIDPKKLHELMGKNIEK